MREFMLTFGTHYEKTMTNFEMAPELTDHAQSVFTTRRAKEVAQGDGTLVTSEETMHRWLTIGRYLSMMAGST